MHHNNSHSSSVATSSSSSSEEEEDYNFELNIALTVLKQQHAKLPPHQPSISPSKKNKRGEKRRRKRFHHHHTSVMVSKKDARHARFKMVAEKHSHDIQTMIHRSKHHAHQARTRLHNALDECDHWRKEKVKG